METTHRDFFQCCKPDEHVAQRKNEKNKSNDLSRISVSDKCSIYFIMRMYKYIDQFNYSSVENKRIFCALEIVWDLNWWRQRRRLFGAEESYPIPGCRWRWRDNARAWRTFEWPWSQCTSRDRAPWLRTKRSEQRADTNWRFDESYINWWILCYKVLWWLITIMTIMRNNFLQKARSMNVSSKQRGESCPRTTMCVECFFLGSSWALKFFPSKKGNIRDTIDSANDWCTSFSLWLSLLNNFSLKVA